jgi:hypothetical protein
MSPLQVVILSYLVASLLGIAGVTMIFLSTLGAGYLFMGTCVMLFVGAMLLKRIRMEGV